MPSIINDNNGKGNQIDYFELMRKNQNFYFDEEEYIFVKEYKNWVIYLSPPTRTEREEDYKKRKGLAHVGWIRPILFNKLQNDCYIIDYSAQTFDYHEKNKKEINFSVLFNCSIQAIAKLDEKLNPISAILFVCIPQDDQKLGDYGTSFAFFSYNGRTYAKQIKQRANVEVNVKDLTIDNLKSLLDINIKDVTRDQSKIYRMDTHKMFIPGYSIPDIEQIE